MEETRCFDVPVIVYFDKNEHNVQRLFGVLAKVMPSRLYLFQNGSDNEENEALLNACYEYVKTLIDWPCDVKFMRYPEDVGSAAADVYALKWMFKTEEMGIFIEDDQYPEVTFFDYCRELLLKYKDNKDISYISGVNPWGLFGDPNYDYFFSTRGSLFCWGTWKRFVDLFDDDYSWLDLRDCKGILMESCTDAYGAKTTIKNAKAKRAEKKLDIEILACVTTVFHHMLSVVPSRNLIMNCGVDAGTQNGSDKLSLMPKKNQKQFFAKTYPIVTPLREPPAFYDEPGYKRFYRSTFFSRLHTKMAVLIRRIVFGHRRKK